MSVTTHSFIILILYLSSTINDGNKTLALLPFHWIGWNSPEIEDTAALWNFFSSFGIAEDLLAKIAKNDIGDLLFSPHTTLEKIYIHPQYIMIY